MKRILGIYNFIILLAVAAGSCSPSARKSSSAPTAQDASSAVDSSSLRRYIITDTLSLKVFHPSKGVRFFRDSLLFLSPAKNERRMVPIQINFGNVEAYYALSSDPGEEHRVFSKSTRFVYPAEAVTFMPDYKTVYFTDILSRDRKEKIYTAVYDNRRKGWIEDDIPLWFCHEGIRYTHPALSPDGTLLVFSSDMAGGSGKMDLYVSRRESDKWSLPENLGVEINSPGDEMYPFIARNNLLFFSSDGLKGYGDHDIFACQYRGKGWDLPVNLSGEINTKNSDLAFTMNGASETVAVFSSASASDIDLVRVKKGQLPLADSIKTLPLTLYALGLADRNFSYKFRPVAPVAAEKPGPAPEPGPTQVAKAPPREPPAPEPVAAALPPAAEKKDVILYRVQIQSSVKPLGKREIDVNGVKYMTYEYYYLREYRSTIGEFSTLRPAVNLQNALRRSGRKEAFVVAFKNNVRSLDMSL
nr:hypothetical protein [Bacteroidales bacterium]